MRRLEKRIRREAARTRAQLGRSCPWLTDTDPAALDAYTVAHARSGLLHERFAAQSRRGFDDRLLELAEQATAAANEARELGHELGLSPLGRTNPGPWWAFRDAWEPMPNER